MYWLAFAEILSLAPNQTDTLTLTEFDQAAQYVTARTSGG